MKVRSALKLMCKKCKMVKRGKKQFVICPENARHKQRQAFHSGSTMLVTPSSPLDLLANRTWTRYKSQPWRGGATRRQCPLVRCELVPSPSSPWLGTRQLFFATPLLYCILSEEQGMGRPPALSLRMLVWDGVAS